jgi:hypothetical protein
MRAMLKEAGLLFNFWNKAIKHDTYIRNYTNIRLGSNSINQSPSKVFTDILLNI